MEKENTTTEPSERPERETEKSVSNHINPISLRYLRDAWKELKEENEGTVPSNDQVVERAARNKLNSTNALWKELDKTEAQMALTLERAIAKKERDEKIKAAGKDSTISTIAPEEPPTEFWEDFPEMIPEEQHKKRRKDDEPLDWLTRWEWEKEEREEKNRRNFIRNSPQKE